MPAGPVYEEVAIDGPNGKLGEFDKIYPGLFVEEKSATGISKGLKFSGKTYAQAAEDWAASNVYKKTATRITVSVRRIPFFPVMVSSVFFLRGVHHGEGGTVIRFGNGSGRTG